MPYQLRYKVPHTEFEILATCDNTTEVHRQMEYLGGLYGTVGQCTCCSGPTRAIVRVVKPKDGKKGGTYFEWWCDNQDCRAKLPLHSFDPEKSGKTGLYKKWDENWEVYKPEESQPPI